MAVATAQPIGLRWRSNTPFIISTIAIGLFTDLFLYGLVVPILPFLLQSRLGIPHSDVQKYSSLLLACHAGASVLWSIPAGVIVDRVGERRGPFLVGLAALWASTVMLYVGRSIGWLVAARVLQGISGATVWIVGLAMILDTVGSAKLGLTLGSILGINGIGNIASPVLGGWAYKMYGDNGVFAIGFGLLAIDFLMRLLVVDKKAASKYGSRPRFAHDIQKIDGARDSSFVDDGAAEIGETAPLISYKALDAEEYRIPKDLPAIVLKFPMIYCMSNPRLLMSQGAAFMQAVVLTIFDATIPPQAQGLFGFDSFQIGSLFLSLALPYLFFAPAGAKAVDKYGAKFPATASFAFLALPLALFRPQPGSALDIVQFCICVASSGAGLGLISAPSFVEASVVTELYHMHNPGRFGENGPYAQLYAINSIFLSLSRALGPLMAGYLSVTLGYGNMNAVLAGLCLVTSGLCFCFLGERRGSAKEAVKEDEGN